MEGQLPDRVSTEELLTRILASPSFSQSGRLRDLLTFLVQRSLAGRQAEIKESVIAAEVFGRSTYDPRTDSLVRVTISTLRNKLVEYYNSGGASEPIRIQIPKGSYMPVFSVKLNEKPVSRRWWLAGAGVASCAAGVAALLWDRQASASNRVAVLPFLDLTAEKDLDYFCDGLTEELINRLAHSKDLEVIARTSSFFYKGKAQDIRMIGQQLDVPTVVEGSIRRSGDELRVTVQLNRTDSGAHLWSQVYEIRMGDIFATQDRIVTAVERTLTRPARGPSAVSPERPENLDAWEHLFRARAFVSGNAPQALPLAIAECRKALKIDSSFAQAHAELARALNHQVMTTGVPDAAGAAEAQHHAAEAVRLDPSLALGHAALGRCLQLYVWDWRGAERACRRAVELEPGSEFMLTALGNVLGDRGRKESVGLLRRAVNLDPMYWGAPQQLGKALYLTRNYNEAIRTGELTIRAHRAVVPLWFRNYITISLAEGARGNHQRAVETAELGWGHEANRSNIGWIGLAGHAYAKWGKRDKAVECLNQLQEIGRHRRLSSLTFARIYMGLNDADRTFEFLNRAIDERDPNLTWVEVDPRFDGMRNDTRWASAVKRIGSG